MSCLTLAKSSEFTVNLSKLDGYLRKYAKIGSDTLGSGSVDGIFYNNKTSAFNHLCQRIGDNKISK